MFAYKITKAWLHINLQDIQKSFERFLWWGQDIFNAGHSKIKHSYGVFLVPFF